MSITGVCWKLYVISDRQALFIKTIDAVFSPHWSRQLGLTTSQLDCIFNMTCGITPTQGKSHFWPQ